MVCDVYVGYVKFILGDQVYPKCKLVSILGIIPWSGSLYSYLYGSLHFLYHFEYVGAQKLFI